MKQGTKPGGCGQGDGGSVPVLPEACAFPLFYARVSFGEEAATAKREKKREREKIFKISSLFPSRL